MMTLINNIILCVWKLPREETLKVIIPRKKTGEVVSIKLTVLIISQYVHISNHVAYI